MIRTIYQLDFIHASGTMRLLSAGDGCDREPAPSISQTSSQWAEDGGAWGGYTAQGGASASVDFTARKYHASHAAAREYCLLAAALFPSARTGILRFTLSAAVWEMPDAVLTATAPVVLVESGRFATNQSFSITGGRPVPITAITLFPGVPVELIHQAIETLTLPIENY